MESRNAFSEKTTMPNKTNCAAAIAIYCHLLSTLPLQGFILPMNIQRFYTLSSLSWQLNSHKLPYSLIFEIPNYETRCRQTSFYDTFREVSVDF